MMLNPMPVWTSFSRETVQFPLRGFSLLIPLELLTSPSAIMGVLRTPLGLWHPGPGCPSAPGRHSSPLLGVWHSTLHPRLPCWMPSSPFQFWHCMQGSPHPAVQASLCGPLCLPWTVPHRYHPSLAPPNGFRTALFWKRGKGPYETSFDK